MLVWSEMRDINMTLSTLCIVSLWRSFWIIYYHIIIFHYDSVFTFHMHNKFHAKKLYYQSWELSEKFSSKKQHFRIGMQTADKQIASHPIAPSFFHDHLIIIIIFSTNHTNFPLAQNTSKWVFLQSWAVGKYIYYKISISNACTLTMNTHLCLSYRHHHHHYPGSKQVIQAHFITFFNKPIIIRLTFLTETHTLLKFFVCSFAFMHCVWTKLAISCLLSFDNELFAQNFLYAYPSLYSVLIYSYLKIFVN